MRVFDRAREFFARLFSGATPKQSDSKLDSLQRAINYQFTNPSFLTHSLTHKSVIPIEDRKGLQSNERLEFLGDSIINSCVTEYLYHRFPQENEGHLTKIKSLAVSRKILGELGHELSLDSYLYLGTGEREVLGKGKDTIVSNAFEAVCGAIFLDGGFCAAKAFLQPRLLDRIEALSQEARNTNYKSTILELAQSDGFGTPRYAIVATEGPEHAKHFTVRILVGGCELGVGTGPSKKLAEQHAAMEALNNYDKSYITESQSKE